MAAGRDIPGPSCAAGPISCSGRPYVALFAAFLLHNLEEASGLTGWARAELSVELSAQGFERAVAGLTVLAGGLLVAAMLNGWRRWLQLGVAALAGGLLANVASHMLGSLVTMSYMPGLGTALALVLPAALWMLRLLPAPRRGRNIAAVVGAVAMAPVAGLALWLAGAI